MATYERDLPTIRRRFVRLFNCPQRSERFEATLTLTETLSEPIESVDVGALDG
jgi:hypothetical protein